MQDLEKSSIEVEVLLQVYSNKLYDIFQNSILRNTSGELLLVIKFIKRFIHLKNTSTSNKPDEDNTSSLPCFSVKDLKEGPSVNWIKIDEGKIYK